MILQLLHTIKTALSTASTLGCSEMLSNIRTLDLDRGQLDNPSNYESILQPALLVGIPSIAWSELAHGHQSGDMRFYTKTVVRMPQNYAYYSEDANFEALSEENQNELLIEDAIHQLIAKIPGVVRTSTSYSYVDTFFIVEHTYELTVKYDNTPKYRHHSFTQSGTPGITVILDAE
jgi:hypothetical protein